MLLTRADRCSRGQRAGCPELTEAIMQRGVPVSVSGHIHDGYGWTTSANEGTLFINASTCNSKYSPTNPPIVFDAPPAEELHGQRAQRAAQDPELGQLALSGSLFAGV